MPKPTPWNDEDITKVCSLLVAFATAEEVAACMGVEPDQLDTLSEWAFDEPFSSVVETYHAKGRAMLRDAILSKAMGGDVKAMDMLAREHLGMDPVRSRRKAQEPEKPPEPVEDKEAALLKFIPGAAG